MRKKKFPGHGGAKKCAEAFGVAPQAWNGWEKGTKTPGDANQRKLADFFGITVGELRGDEKAPNAKAPGAELLMEKQKTPPASTGGGQIVSFQERVAMDMKKALQNYQKMGTTPLVIHIFHTEYRVVYKIIDLGDAVATLSTSYPIDRDTADAVLKGQTDPDWTDRDTGKPERLTQVIRYDDIASVDFGG